jgi:hypothetical protein
VKNMSIRTVERSIRHALADNKLTKAEAENIIATAEKGPITTGEARRIADLYEKGQWFMPNTFPPGALPQPRPPQYQMEDGAAQPLLNFFIAERVPQGSMYKPVKEDIEAALKNVDYNALALDTPPNTKNLHHVHLKDMRMVDGPRTDAYVDTNKDEFYLKVTGAGMAGPDTIGPYWHGPIPLKELSPTERVADKVDAWTLANKIGLSTTRTHTPRVTDVQDLGNGEFDVELSAINWQDPSDVRDVKRAVVDKDGVFLRAAGDPTQQNGLRPDVLQNMKDAFNAQRGNLQFSASGLPAGERMERVLLETTPGFDTYSYYAMVPVGALAPGAPRSDPNDATSIFIAREGGFAGITMYAGPVNLP